MKIINWWGKFNSILDKILLIVAATVMVGVLACISLEGILRNTIGFTSGWMEEFPRLFMVFPIFLLMGPLLRMNKHITSDIVGLMIKQERPRVVLKLAVQLCVVVGGAIMMWAGIAGVRGFQQIGMVTATEIEIPLWILYLSVPIGSAVLIEEALEMACKTALELCRGEVEYKGVGA